MLFYWQINQCENVKPSIWKCLCCSLIYHQCQLEAFKDFKALPRIAEGAIGVSELANMEKWENKEEMKKKYKSGYMQLEKACARLKKKLRERAGDVRDCLGVKVSSSLLWHWSELIYITLRIPSFKKMRQMSNEGKKWFVQGGFSLPLLRISQQYTVTWVTSGNSSSCYSISSAQHFHVYRADRLKP